MATVTDTTRLSGSTARHSGLDTWTYISAKLGDPSLLNVLNLRDFGAVGDGVADDTAAIQDAVDAIVGYVRVVDKPRRIYVPPGEYKITAPIDLNEVTNSIIFSGEGRWSRIVGTLSGSYLFDRDGTNLMDGPCGFERLFIQNFANNGSDLDSGGVRFLGTNQFTIRDCGIYTTGGIGLALYLDNHTNTIHSTFIHGNENLGIGLLAVGHCDIRACDFAGFDEGMRVSGPETNIQACRTEVCNIAYHLGMDHAGDVHVMNNGSFIGNITEACSIGLYARAVASCLIAGNAFTSNDLVYDPQVGVRILSAQNATFSSNSVSGIWQDAGFRIDSSPDHCAFIANGVNITSGGGVDWHISSGVSLTTSEFLANTGI